MNFLSSLNERQREAVEYTEGPLMILAGAGSGKTRVLTYKIAYLIGNGVDPFNILALTFTNKAAQEMKKRIEQLVGTEARNLWMGTFHSIFARILRIEGHRLGYPSNFTIYDTEDSKSLIKSIVKELNLDVELYKPSMVLARISAAKNRLIGPEHYEADAEIRAEDASVKRPHIYLIYKKYAERCFKASAMDFDDLLFNTNVLFRLHLDVLGKYQHRFQYIMVDEFQDTNVSQYLIIKKLAQVHQNIAVVGDDAQSIYAFRGADIQNILSFEKDFPDVKFVKLEQNYRSTQIIVNAANSVIEKNQKQFKKNIWTNNELGDLIEIHKVLSDNDEGKLVSSLIFENRVNKQMKYSDFAILYRTNYQSRSFEEALRKIGIKYRIIGGLSFYQRKEIKDVLAYFRLAINPNDEEAFKRVVNYPKRGIGEASVLAILANAAEKNISIWEAVQLFSQGTSKSAAGALQFVNLIKNFSSVVAKKDAYETAKYIVKTSGIEKELYDDKTLDGVTRYQNLQELLNAAQEFVESADNEDKSLVSFMQDIAILTDVDVKDDESENDDKVTLMTIHSAKGLEFPHVFVVGMEEDLFPSLHMLQSRDDLEEERRLFYVAITRAQKSLTLTYSLTRYKSGQLRTCQPSRFLSEIDPQYVKFVSSSKASHSVTNHLQNSGAFQFLKRKASGSIFPELNSYQHKVSQSFSPSDLTFLKEGMKVEHPKFGFGIVKKLEKTGIERKATIDFEWVGEKTLLLNFAKLMILEQ